MTCKGGNTEALYKLDGKEDGRLLMAQSLADQHPDVCKITRKWGRWQHQVDYRSFKKNKLRLKDGVSVKDVVDNYGMVLKNIERDEIVEIADGLEVGAPPSNRKFQEVRGRQAIV